MVVELRTFDVFLVVDYLIVVSHERDIVKVTSYICRKEDLILRSF